MLRVAHSRLAVVALTPRSPEPGASECKPQVADCHLRLPEWKPAPLPPQQWWACAPGGLGWGLSGWGLRWHRWEASLLHRLLGLPSGFLIQRIWGGAWICVSEQLLLTQVLLPSPRAPVRP